MRKFFFSLTTLCAMFVLLGQGCFNVGGGPEGGNTSGSAGMYVSSNAGEDWQQISALPKADEIVQLTGVSVYRLFDDPQDPRAFYWASRDNGLFYTYDEGRNWQQLEGPVSDGFIYSVAVHPTNKCLVYVSNGSLVFKTDDCSRTWSEVFRETRPNVRAVSVAFNPREPHEIYLAESNGDVHKTLDGGSTWTTLARLRVEVDKVEVDSFDSNVIYVATRDHGLVRSLDRGATWEVPKDTRKKIRQFTKANEYRRFFTSPSVNGTIYWISRFGILVSTDSGETWEALNLLTPPATVDIYGFAVNPNNPQQLYYTASVGGRSTLYKSVDGGSSWATAKKLPSQRLPTALRVHPDPDRSDVIYLGFTILPD